MRRPVLVVLAVVAAGGATLPACAEGTVRVAFRPRVDARYSYRVEVRTRSTLRLEGSDPQSADRTVSLLVDQTVLSAGAEESVVEVKLRTTPEDERTVLVRLDRAAQLVGLEPVTGRGTAPIADLGVAEVFPAAVGAPPNRPLRPGERWEVDSPVRLAASVPSRLVGDGRLTRLGVVEGKKAATVTTAGTLFPVVRRTATAQGNEAVLEGTQHTTTTASHALADGAIQASRSTTRGSYDLRLLPPSGVGDPIRGTLDLEVTSRTTRS